MRTANENNSMNNEYLFQTNVPWQFNYSGRRLRALLLTLIVFSGTCLSLNQMNAAPIQDDSAAMKIAQTASAAQNGDDFEFAAEQWETLIKEYPTSKLIGKAHYNAGVCYLKLEQPAQAIPRFQASLEKLTDAETTKKPLAMLYLGFTQFQEGQNLASEAKSKEANKLFGEAVKTFSMLLEKNPQFDNADQAFFFQGNALEALGDRKQALVTYSKILSLPEPAFKLESLFAVADLHDQLQQYEQASEFFQKAGNVAAELDSPLLIEIQSRTAANLVKLALKDSAQKNSPAATDKLKQAESILESIVSQNEPDSDMPSNAILNEAKYELAVCSRELKNYQRAAALFEEISNTPESPLANEALANAGRNYLDAEQPKKAIPLLERAIKVDPVNGTLAAHWLAGIYLKSEEPSKAFAIAKKQINKVKSNEKKPIGWVNLLMDQADAAFAIPNKRKSSIALFDNIATSYQANDLAPLALHSSAFTSLDTGDFETAIKTANAFESTFPANDLLPDTVEIKAEAQLLNDQPDEAKKTYDQLVAQFKGNAKAIRWTIRSAVADYISENYSQAISKLQPLTASKEVDANQLSEIEFWIGSSQFKLGQFADAEKSLTNSFAKNKQWKRTAETLLTLCRSQLAQKKATEATTTSEIFLKNYSNSPLATELHYRLGESDYELEKYQSALKHFQLINNLELATKFTPFSLYNAAYCQFQINQHQAAVKTFTTLISQFPDNDLANLARTGRANAQRKLGNPKAAIEDLNKFLSTKPESDRRESALYDLGLAQIDAQQWNDVSKTFQVLVNEFTTSQQMDRYLYELAWGLRSSDKENLAMDNFRTLASKFPASSLAPESNFHIGSEFYRQENYNDAIVAYQLCLDSKTGNTILEKAAYKLAWSHYKQDQFKKAGDQFSNQVKRFPDGDLVADGLFMTAESLYRLKDYEAALAAYQTALPAVANSTLTEPKIQWLARVHAAQSANQIKQYQEAIALLEPFESLDPDQAPAGIPMLEDAMLEIGLAYSGLRDPKKALSYFNLAAKSEGKTGARARCMIGDSLFGNKQFADAIKEFKKVYYGFNGLQATPDVRPWQAYAVYESARCSFVQIKNAPRTKQPALAAAAIKQFEYLLKNYSDDKLVPETRRQLEQLKKMKFQ